MPLVLKYSASNLSVSGSAINTALDESGNSNDGNQTTSGQRPQLVSNSLNSLPGIGISGTEQLIATKTATINDVFKNGGGYVIMVLTNKGAPNGSSNTAGALLSKGNWTLQTSAYSAGSSKLEFSGNWTSSFRNYFTGAAVFADNTPYIFEFSFNDYNNGNVPRFILNAVEEALGTTGGAGSGNLLTDSATNLGIGGLGTNAGTFNIHSDINELEIYSGIPSAAQKIARRTAFATQYAISLSSKPLARCYLFAGQSNGVGEAKISEVGPPYNGTIANAKIWNQGTSTFDNLTAGTTNQALDSTTFGPEMSFMNAITGFFPTETIYLIKTTVVNTDLATNWAASPSSPGVRYSNMQINVRLAMANLRAAGLEPNIDAVVWMQGENDAEDSTRSSAYQANLINFVTDIRNFLGGYATINFPFIIMQLGAITNVGFPYTSTVQTAQTYVGNNTDGTTPNCVLITSTDLGLNVDGLHFNGPAQVTLGQRYAGAIQPSAIAPGAITASGLTASITVSESTVTGGQPPYTYQWYRSTVLGTKGSAVVGATQATLTQDDLVAGTTYYYTCTIGDSLGNTPKDTSQYVVIIPTAGGGGGSVIGITMIGGISSH